jgi:hypothetical protein
MRGYPAVQAGKLRLNANKALKFFVEYHAIAPGARTSNCRVTLGGHFMFGDIHLEDGGSRFAPVKVFND